MNLLLKLWYFVPAAVGNATPVLVRWKPLRQLPNAPIDFGAVAWDGNRIFGDGKTFLGIFFGISAGTLVGFLQGQALLGFLLSSGALAGDLAAAFVKRRFGLPRGTPVPFLDQLDLILGAVLLTLPVGFFQWSFQELLVLCVITLPIHRIFGILGHKAGVKREPW
jgi:CDP-2,3-bis-(O-geranylgeranyl)-sn-glycerol synthase